MYNSTAIFKQWVFVRSHKLVPPAWACTHTPWPDPPISPLGVGLETPLARPLNIPLGVGLETPRPDPSTSPPGCGPGDPPVNILNDRQV